MFVKKPDIEPESDLPLSPEEIEQTMYQEISEITVDEDMKASWDDIELPEDMAEPVDSLVIETEILITPISQSVDEEEISWSWDATSEELQSASTPETEQLDNNSTEKNIESIKDTSANSKSYDYIFAAAQEEWPEIPKDLEASRNIAKWHSRDDIVRDKFEKHIQKIRYEIGILKQRNDILGYEKKLVEWITLLPNDIDFQKQLADLYFHQGKYKKAQSLLKKILLDNPSDHYALWQVGEIASVEGNTEDAYLYLQQAYAACDDNPKYCFSLAQWYYDHDALEQALPLMEKMVKIRPKNIEYLVSLSHVQYKMWMIDQARQSLLRALELDPMNVTLKNYLKAL